MIFRIQFVKITKKDNRICFQIHRNMKYFKIQYEAFKGEAKVTKSSRTLTFLHQI